MANYHNRDLEIVAQKIRLPGKEFPWTGTPKDVMPFGYHLWRKGKRLTIVEGEKDALAMSEIYKNQWPVWSTVNGAAGLAKDLQRYLRELEEFDEIVLLMDSDEAGQEAQQKAAEALLGALPLKLAPPLPLKDVADMLAARRSDEVLKATWNAAPYKPASIVSGAEVVERLKRRLASGELKGDPYPWDGLNEKIQGARPGEIVTIVAGSGTGKSTVCRTLMRHFHETTDKIVGGCFLEEDVDETLAGILSLGIGKNILTDARLEVYGDAAEVEADRLFAEKALYLYDLRDQEFDTEKLLSQIRYMAVGLGCRYLFLDHLSFVVGGMEIADERKALDLAMTKLRKLVKATGITLFLVVHLKRPDGNRGYDEGLAVSTNHIRGSQGIEQLSNIVVALQRNKRDDKRKDILEVVVLKNRFSGQENKACDLRYDSSSGRLTEIKATDVFLEDMSDEEGLEL